MYASLVRYKIKPGSIAELSRRVQETLYPRISKEPGFVGHYLVHDGEEEIVAVALYEHEAATTGIRAIIGEWFDPAIGDLIVERGPRVIQGAVTARAGAAS